MPTYVVLEDPSAWQLELPGAQVVSAQDYLSNSKYSESKRAKVFNLCATYSYQTLGYYVSLLASARGHRPLPSVATLQDLRQGPLLKIISRGIHEEMQKSLGDLKTDNFSVSIYFGRNLAKRYDRLARSLFNTFPAPFLRAQFRRLDVWELEDLKPIASDEIPQSHWDFVVEQAKRYFERPDPIKDAVPYRYDMGILVNPDEENSPSNKGAIKNFMKAARRLGISTTLLQREDYGRLAEFDALFIRETTQVNHHTYRFARRAAAEGLVVIDDPESILRCTNKVYLSELFQKHNISCPKTFIVQQSNMAEIEPKVSYPAVIKKPDSSFSVGISKVDSPQQLREGLCELLKESDLVIVQEFVRSDFDWRIGIINNQAMYACRYYFAKGDWRIQTTDAGGRRNYGRVETVPIEQAPKDCVALALRATAPIGTGLYGVDVKESAGRFYVMEVNDNPSIDAGLEDAILKDSLYEKIMHVFLDRLERRGRAST